jgi:hypothetical protein
MVVDLWQGEVVAHLSEDAGYRVGSDGSGPFDAVAEGVGVGSELYVPIWARWAPSSVLKAQQGDAGFSEGVVRSWWLLVGFSSTRPGRSRIDLGQSNGTGGVEVDVAPFEGAEFSAPGAGEGGEHDRGGEDRVARFGRLDEGRHLNRPWRHHPLWWTVGLCGGR